MIKYNLLETNSDDNKLLPSSNETIQQYGGTTVTISGIPALEARMNNSASTSVEDSTESQM